MEKYKSNSHRSKEEKKTVEREKVQKVVRGKTKTRKKSEVRKAVDNFISEDVSNIKTYLISDVLIPTIKNTIWDALTNSLDMVLFDGKGRNKRSSGSKVSYRNFYDRRERDDRRPTRDRRDRFDYDDIVFESRGEAEAVLEMMDEMIDRYDVVTVSDMYDMADQSAPYTANRYGWMNLRNAEVARVRGGGYILKLPKALPID